MTREPDSFLKLQIRRLATGFCWAVFGIGGLTLSLTAFPVIRAATDSKETSVLRTRRLISASFRLFFRLTHLLGVMEADTAGIQCLKDKKGVILVANHPTLIDYVLIASVIPETDCIVKSALTGNFFLKRVVRAADYIVNSEDPSDLVRDAEARLAKGGVLLIFPEGTRTKPGITPTLHRGAAQIAVRTDTPIEVIQIESSDPWLTKGAPWYAVPPRKPIIRLSYVGRLTPQPLEDPEAAPAAARSLTAKIFASLRFSSEPAGNNGKTHTGNAWKSDPVTHY